MAEFNPWVIPLNNVETETSLTGWTLEYEDFPCDVDVTAPLLYTLFEQNWQQVGIAHVVECSRGIQLSTAYSVISILLTNSHNQE